MKGTLKETASALYFGENYNCAETILRAASEYYKMDLSDNEMKLMGGFGGGLSAGKTCGALCGAMAVIGRLLVEGRAKETEGFWDACAELVARFEAKLGHCDCSVLKPENFKDDVRCVMTVEAAAEVLEAFIAEKVPAERLETK